MSQSYVAGPATSRVNVYRARIWLRALLKYGFAATGASRTSLRVRCPSSFKEAQGPRVCPAKGLVQFQPRKREITAKLQGIFGSVLFMLKEAAEGRIIRPNSFAFS